ncbi:MAG: pectinesterase family protein [Clostridia bacterium]|nr:pectinesterase family protein [Clostridia bacterium]
MKIKCKRLLSAVLSASMILGVMPVFAATATKTQTITVGKNEECDYKSIQEAVNSIKDMPTEKYRAVIRINPGTYNEEVSIDKPYISLVNTSKDKDVIITYDKANGHSDVSKNFGTDKTATVTVKESAAGFKAENITFVNSYNIDEPDNDVRKQVQAVALETLADKVVLEGCKLIGRQDTLYLKGASKGQQVEGSSNSARVYLNNCYIEGTVDFIFGDATAYFNNCNLHMVYYKNGGHFTAPNTTLYNIGYVFNNCKLTVDKEYTRDMADKIDLGRPWQCDGAYPNYGSNAVFINCTMPEIMNEAGFSLWDEGTVINKVRFFEYGSKQSNGRAMDLSKRADFVKILTEEQAKGYTAYNVLKGNDNWNPSGNNGVASSCDVTLNSYTTSVPKGETFQLRAYSLPMENADSIKYSSSDDAVATVNEKGVITANKEGKAIVYAVNGSGMKTFTNVTVTAARTALPEAASVGIINESNLVVGQKLAANYSYVLNSDNAIDAAKLRWCAVKGNEKIVLKEGVGEYYSTYTILQEDIGCNIMLEVYPASTTTYGEYGTPVEYTTAGAVMPKSGESGAIYRTGFENINDWTTEGKWNCISKYNNNFVTADCDSNNRSFIKYSKGNSWDNITLKGRFRFNPEKRGLSSDGFYNVYMNYSENGKDYYVLKVGRGSNTKSLMLYLYKAVNGEEILLSSDTTSLKNNICQNAGEENPYFTMELTKNNGNIEMYFYIEGISKYMAKLSAADSTPLSAGTIAFEAGGDSDVVLMDSISVISNNEEDSTHKTKLYLMGDSTAVSYGDDNTIGGWGEYLVNYFNDDVEIINKAEGGRSARSYLNQGRLKEVYNEVGPGDYVFIQFGTNDQRTDTNAFMEHAVMLGEPNTDGIYPTIPGIKTKTPQYIYDFYKDTDYPYGETFYPYESGTFKWYMLQHVAEIKKTGATPVLLTPMCRLFFDSEGKIVPHFGENDGYIEAIRQLADEEDIVCLDMYDITKKLYESYGVMTTQGLHNIKSDGTVDLTHYNKFGANLIASKMAEALKSSVLTIRKDIINSSVAVGKTDALKSANLYVLGSTAAAGSSNDNMAVESGGFGDYLQKYLSAKISVKNLAVADATVKSYIKTEEYNTFINNLSEGDYVIINFGENDADYISNAREYSKYSYPSNNDSDIDSFSYYLYNNYIKPAKEKKAVVIVTTPAAKRNFVEGVYTANNNPYVENVVAMVQKYSTFYVNINNVTADMYSTMGEEGSKVLNAYDRDGGINNSTFSKFGAELTAKRFLTMMQQSSASLKDYINNDALTSASYMTRADFVTMIMNVLDIDNTAYNNFDDVVKGKYYENAIGSAKEIGIIKAESGNNFKPEEVLTGETAVDILKNVLDYKNINGNLDDVYKLLKGDVSNEIGIWAVDRLYEELN